MVVVHSATKGLAAMTLAIAHSRGWLDYEERVAAYWPEFAQCGKERNTVRQHRVRICDQPDGHRLYRRPARRRAQRRALHGPQVPATECGDVRIADLDILRMN
jgi:hypothetical protein